MLTYRGQHGAQEHVQVERYLVREFGGVGVEARGHVAYFGAVEEAWLLVQDALEQHLCEVTEMLVKNSCVLSHISPTLTFRTRTPKRAICGCKHVCSSISTVVVTHIWRQQST